LSSTDEGDDVVQEIASTIVFYMAARNLPEADSTILAEYVSLKIYAELGGRDHYIKRTPALEHRNKQIRAQFNGRNITDLVKSWGLTRQRIYQILKQNKKNKL
jgi:Mor family transcriptional regulator